MRHRVNIEHDSVRDDTDDDGCDNEGDFRGGGIDVRDCPERLEYDVIGVWYDGGCMEEGGELTAQNASGR
jgi:hypothetical protein